MPSEKLFEYVEGCLTRGFGKSGAALQDLINELGRRLDYEVENGFYQGRSNAVGFDGIWHAPDDHSLIVEVKTTDAYRINPDTIAAYRDALINSVRIGRQSSILVVVGRSDTGDIEAQVRGSKHAWDIRLISTDALVKLVKLKESTDEEETVAKIRGLLKPFEYTRLDNIIDVMFTTAKNVEASAELGRSFDKDIVSQWRDAGGLVQDHTKPEIINELRRRVVHAFAQKKGVDLIAKSRALYRDAGRTVAIACSISKRYPRGTYWYAHHPHWDRFLAEGQDSFLVLACVDRATAYALPRSFATGVLDQLYTTSNKDTGKIYWHIHLEEGRDVDDMYFSTGKSGKKVSLHDCGFTLRLRPIFDTAGRKELDCHALTHAAGGLSTTGERVRRR